MHKVGDTLITLGCCRCFQEWLLWTISEEMEFDKQRAFRELLSRGFPWRVNGWQCAVFEANKAV
jgi:hypothetical protein